MRCGGRATANTESGIPSRRRRTNRSRFIASPIRRVPNPGGFGERKILKASRSGGRRCQGGPQPGEELRLKEIVTGYALGAPKLALWLEENLSQGLTVFTLPAAHQKRMRTSNALERVNQELKRRTRVARVFPNEQSLLRLISALLVETIDEWETTTIYLNMKSCFERVVMEQWRTKTGPVMRHHTIPQYLLLSIEVL